MTTGLKPRACLLLLLAAGSLAAGCSFDTDSLEFVPASQLSQGGSGGASAGGAGGQGGSSAGSGGEAGKGEAGQGQGGKGLGAFPIECRACVLGKCAPAVTMCEGNPTCGDCLSNLKPGCATMPEFVGVLGCACNECGDTCKVPGCGAGGMGGASGSAGAGGGQAGQAGGGAAGSGGAPPMIQGLSPQCNSCGANACSSQVNACLNDAKCLLCAAGMGTGCDNNVAATALKLCLCGACDADCTELGCGQGCGNKVCDANEDPMSCPSDCSCGDGVCSNSEFLAHNCAQDCGVCGDGVVHEPDEQCDALIVPLDCAAYTGSPDATGTLKCTPWCTFDGSQCFVPDAKCGDGLLAPGEECDGENFGTHTCATITGNPMSAGALKCRADCTIDPLGCQAPPGTLPKCGDGFITPAVGEECDGNRFGAKSCATVTKIPGSTGSLVCGPGCKIDPSQCLGGAMCGNGQIDVGEDCDATNLNGQDCSSLTGMPTQGTLKCSSTCHFDKTGCAVCGDGVCTSGFEDVANCPIDCNSCNGQPLSDGDGCTEDVCEGGQVLHKAIANCCPHSLCLQGTKIDATGCDFDGGAKCASAMCGGSPPADTYCCQNGYDSTCVSHVSGVNAGAPTPALCKPSDGSPQFTCDCAHSYCQEGGPLSKDCDPCVEAVCNAMPQCCQNGWLAECVTATHAICHVPLGQECK